MLYDANLDALKRCVRNNESSTDFNLQKWIQPCGTFGCLVGNDFIRQGKGRLAGLANAEDEYGLPRIFAQFLFCAIDAPHRQSVGIDLVRFIDGSLAFCPISDGNQRPPLNKSAAMNRILKFIAYIERKRAIWYEADGRIKESARRTEGNYMVCASVMQSIAVSA